MRDKHSPGPGPRSRAPGRRGDRALRRRANDRVRPEAHHPDRFQVLAWVRTPANRVAADGRHEARDAAARHTSYSPIGGRARPRAKSPRCISNLGVEGFAGLAPPTSRGRSPVGARGCSTPIAAVPHRRVRLPDQRRSSGPGGCGSGDSFWAIAQAGVGECWRYPDERFLGTRSSGRGRRRDAIGPVGS
jgi:hypothetical protein